MNLAEMKDKIETGAAFLQPSKQGYWVLTEFKNVVIDQQGNTAMRPEVATFQKQDIERIVVGHEAEAEGGKAILEKMFIPKAKE